VFDGIKVTPPPDALKHLGASLASYGSMAMFHMVGVTPEAPTAEQALGGNTPRSIITVSEKDIQDVLRCLSLCRCAQEHRRVFGAAAIAL